jgi:hypothetical protein
MVTCAGSLGLRETPQAVQKYPKSLSDQLVFNQMLQVTYNPLFSCELEKRRIKQQVEKTCNIFANLLFYKMARPERLLGLAPSPLRGRRRFTTTLSRACSARLELPTAWFVVFRLKQCILLLYNIFIRITLSNRISLFGFICLYLGLFDAIYLDKGITVSIWVEKGLLFALTDEAGLDPIIPTE